MNENVDVRGRIIYLDVKRAEAELRGAESLTEPDTRDAPVPACQDGVCSLVWKPKRPTLAA